MGHPYILSLDSKKEDKLTQNPVTLAQITHFYSFKFKFGEKIRLKDSQFFAYSVREYHLKPYIKKTQKSAVNISSEQDLHCDNRMKIVFSYVGNSELSSALSF